VTSVVEPLTIWLFKDGLVRLASEKYDLNLSNVSELYMHLTNYSLNKRNEHFDGQKHKLRVADVLSGTLQSREHEKPAEQIWKEIEEIVIKTIITAQPQLAHYYRSSQAKEPDICFELLGFDIMLDYKLKPWLLEVNHTPSFNSDTGVDEQVKRELLHATLKLVNFSSGQRK